MSAKNLTQKRKFLKSKSLQRQLHQKIQHLKRDKSTILMPEQKGTKRKRKKTVGKKQIISLEVKIQSWKVLQKEVADQNMLLKKKAMERFQNLISMNFSNPHQKDLEILKVEATTMEEKFQIEMKEATKRTLAIIGSEHLVSPTREVATVFRKLLEKMRKNWKDINTKISEVLNATIATYIKKLGMNE